MPRQRDYWEESFCCQEKEEGLQAQREHGGGAPQLGPFQGQRQQRQHRRRRGGRPGALPVEGGDDGASV